MSSLCLGDVALVALGSCAVTRIALSTWSSTVLRKWAQTSPSDRAFWNGVGGRPRSHQPGPWPSEAPTLSLFQFSQQEEKRQKSERLQQQQKHENQMRDMAAQCESNMSELQQLQVPPSPLLGSPLQVEGLWSHKPRLKRFQSYCVLLARCHRPQAVVPVSITWGWG